MLRVILKNRLREILTYVLDVAEIGNRQQLLDLIIYANNIPAPISSGFYSTFVRDWLKVFDNDQIMVIRTQDYRHNIAGTLLKVFQFLNLDEVGPYVLEKMACRELKYKTNYRSPIMNKTRSLLETFYYDSQRDMNSLLEEYGIDLSLQPQNEMASKINCSRFIARKPLQSKLKRNKVKAIL